MIAPGTRLPARRVPCGLRHGWLLACALGLLAGGAHAERIEPPLEVLHSPANMLVAGRVLEINPTGRVVFKRGQVLSGKGQPPERIDVRVPVSALARIHIGQRCIFGYTLYGRDPDRPDKAVPNVNGAVMLYAPGLEPALFDDTRGTRAILAFGTDEEHEHGGDERDEETKEHRSPRETRHLLRRLLAVLKGKDAALVNLAAHQIVLDPQLGASLDAKARAALGHAAGDAGTPPDTRSALLVAAARNPGRYGDWWRADAEDIVATTPIDGYSMGALDPSGLVLSAFEVLELHRVAIAPDRLERWVRSSNPSLAEHALLALRHQAPARERAALESALADPALPEATRKFLDDHRRRLDLLQRRLRERKEDSR
jgi:hypothetical protein